MVNIENKIELKAKILIGFAVALISAIIVFQAYKARSDDDRFTLDKRGFLYVAHDDLSQTIIGDIHKELEHNKQRLLEDFKLDSLHKVSVQIWSEESSYLAEQQRVLGKAILAHLAM